MVLWCSINWISIEKSSCLLNNSCFFWTFHSFLQITFSHCKICYLSVELIQNSTDIVLYKAQNKNEKTFFVFWKIGFWKTFSQFWWNYHCGNTFFFLRFPSDLFYSTDSFKKCYILRYWCCRFCWHISDPHESK